MKGMSCTGKLPEDLQNWGVLIQWGALVKMAASSKGNTVREGVANTLQGNPIVKKGGGPPVDTRRG